MKKTLSSDEMEKINYLPPGHEGLVYREKNGRKPYKLVLVRGNELDVVLQSGKTSTFEITSARPFYVSSSDEMRRSQREYTERNNCVFRIHAALSIIS